METILGRYRNLIVLAAILFAQIIGLAVQVKLPAQEGSTRLIRLWAVAAVTPFEKAVVHTQNWVHDTWHGYVYLRNVHKENEQLRDQIERMKLDEVRLSEDAKMARRVQALLAFKEQYVDTTVAAQVIGNSGSEQSRVIYIDKGSRDGLKSDMAVITPTGIVGKIVQVFPDSSQVLPINDQLSGVGAALKDTRLQGILKGGGNGATTLQYVMSDEKVAVGEDVITSGGDRIFPKGLPIGKVVSVEPGKDLFLNIRVLPSARLDRLEEVLVVTKMVEKPPDTKDLGPIRAADILAERLPTVPTQPATDGAGNAANGAAAPNATSANATRTAGSGTALQPAANPKMPIAGATTGSLPTKTTLPTTNGAVKAATPVTNGTLKPVTPATVGGSKPAAPGTSAAAGTHAATTTRSLTGSTGSSATTTPKTAGTTAPVTQSPANASDSTLTEPPPRPPVKKVIVEADPEPASKPARKGPPATSPDAQPANSTPPANSPSPQTEGTPPQR